MPQKPTTDSVNSSSTYPLTLRWFLDLTTWQTTSFLVFSLVRKSNCPGATEEVRRMTAPLPKTRTVLVVSEKGSRLSLPSTVRAPLIVTGTSSATGCCLMAISLGNVVADAGRCAVSGLADKVSFSLAVGGIACTLAKGDFLGRPVPDRISSEHLYVLPPGRAPAIVRSYYGGNTCPCGQVKNSRRARRGERWFGRGAESEEKVVKVIAEEGAGSAGRL